MIIPSVNFLKSNSPSNSLKYQHQPDRLNVSKKHHATSRFWRSSTFLVAGLTCLIMGAAATPVVAQPRVISQFSDRNNEQDVRAIQDALRRLGYFRYPDSTGIFGDFTRQAVLDFQRDNNLPVTGVVDNITANSIFARVQENNPSDRQSIRAIQDRLSRLGYDITIDGVFGSQTQRVITSFQQANNLPVTGVADTRTVNAIFDGDRGVFATLNPNNPDNRERFCRDQNNRNQVCPYVVLIPGDNNRLIDIRQRLLVNYPLLAENIVLEDHGRGLFIRIRQYSDRGEAETVANILRNNISPDFRVEFLPTVTPISVRG
jgi:peptidoglycan hydrolase-like protein with peptidoglycan-binding domain